MTTTAAPDTKPRTRPSDVVTDPTQIHDAFMDATNARDVDALLALYDPDGLAVQLDGGQARGEGALRAMFVGLTSAIAHIDGTTRKVSVVGDTALSSASWTAEVVLPDGTVMQQEGITAAVSRRQPTAPGGWSSTTRCSPDVVPRDRRTVSAARPPAVAPPALPHASSTWVWHDHSPPG